MKRICKIANLLIFVSVATILFTEIYATFNSWTLNSVIMNTNFKTIFIVASIVRVGIIDFKSKEKSDKRGSKWKRQKQYTSVTDAKKK